MTFQQNKYRTLAEIHKEYPDNNRIIFGGFRGQVGYWVLLANGAMIFFELIEAVKFVAPNNGLFWHFSE